VGLVVVPGSAWEVAEDERFRSENLAALGLTVVTFDKRGHGQTPGPSIRPFADTAADVAAVTQWAQGQWPAITTWGALGISRGGWVVPKIDRLNAGYDFLVLAVTPAVTPFVQEFQARLTELSELGLSPEELQVVDAYVQSLVAYARTPNTTHWQNYLDLHRQVVDFRPAAFRGAESKSAAEWEWWGLNGDNDPWSELCEIQIPTRVILGLDDRKIDFAQTANKLLNCQSVGETPYLHIQPMLGVGHDLARPHRGPMWSFDGLGTEGIEEIWQWAMMHNQATIHGSGQVPDQNGGEQQP